MGRGQKLEGAVRWLSQLARSGAVWVALLAAAGCGEQEVRLGDIVARVARAVAAVSAPCPGEIAGLVAFGVVEEGDPRLSGSSLVVAFKSRRRVALYEGGELVEGACYPIALASDAPPGDKVREGDLRTPEGWYRTSDKPWSQFYGAIAVHYPNGEDAERGQRAGRIDGDAARAIRRALARGRKPPQTTPLGGEILLHGGGGGPDWTEGCIALDDSDLDDLRARLPDDLRTWVLVLP